MPLLRHYAPRNDRNKQVPKNLCYNSAVKRDLLNIMACPVCKKPLALTAETENETEIITGSLYCQQCSQRYPIIAAIPHLLPPEQKR